MRIHLIALLLIALVPYAAFAGGDIVRNGGGIAEQNFIYGFLNFSSFASPCLTICQLSPSESTLLRKVLDANVSERTLGQLEFELGSEHPEHFKRSHSDTVRVVNSQPVIGSVIYVNKDLLHPKNSAGIEEPMGLELAVGHLLGEFAFHIMQKDLPEVTGLQLKLATFMNTQKKSTSLSFYGREDTYISAFHRKNSQNIFVDVLLSDGENLFDLSPLIRTSSRCPDKSHVIDQNLTNLYFDLNPIGKTEGKQVEFIAKALLIESCRLGDEVKTSQVPVNISLIFEFTRGSFADLINGFSFTMKFVENSATLKINP